VPSFAQYICWLIVAVAVWLRVWPSLPRASRLPLLVYSISYFATSFIGMSWIGLTDGSILTEYMASGMWIPNIQEQQPVYWALVFLPFIVPVCIVHLLSDLLGVGRTATIENTPSTGVQISQSTYLLVCGGYLAYILWVFVDSGHVPLLNLSLIIANIGNTEVLYSSRMDLFGQGGRVFFGLIYGTMPALTHMSLYSAVQQRSNLWWSIYFVMCGVTLVLGLSTYQVMIPMVFLISMIFSLYHLGYLRLKLTHAIVVTTVVLSTLETLSYIKSGHSTLYHSFQQYAFRMPHAFPYYLEYFRTTGDYSGVRLIGDLTGFFQDDPGLSSKIGEYVYPGSSIAVSIPAPMHIAAYGDWGVSYSVLYLVISGLCIILVSRLGVASTRSAYAFSLFVQGLVMLYYFQQTTLRGALLQSHGIIWSVVGISTVALANFHHLASRREPLPVPPKPRNA
jgi:hypothetical protein